MSWSEFAFIGIACAVTILICRVVPVFALRGRDLPGWLSQALAFIPPAAFAALISNDLLAPGMFDAGFWPFIVSNRFRLLSVLSPELSGVNSGDKLPPMINL